MKIQVEGETAGTVVVGQPGQAAVIDVTAGLVSSVNGQTGGVTITAAELGAEPAGTAVAAAAAAQAAAITTAAADATAKVDAHLVAVDPHGDRAYADGQFFPKSGGTLTGAVTAASFNTDGTVRSANFRTNSDTEHALTVYQRATGTSPGSVALNVISDKPGDSAMWLTGHESARGTLKVAHLNPGPGAADDANAAAISIDLRRNGMAGSAAQGIFVTATDGGTTGRLITLRNGGANLFTVPAAGSVYTATGAFGEQLPVNHGLTGWTYDPVIATTGSILTNGTVYLSKIHVPDDTAITKVYWWVTAVGATATAGQNWVGLYSPAGTRLATTGVDASITSTGLKTTTISSTSVAAGSFVWVAMVFNAATAPTIARATGNGGLATAVNAGLTSGIYRFATNGTVQTTLPATITPGSNTAAGFAGPWAAVGP